MAKESNDSLKKDQAVKFTQQTDTKVKRDTFVRFAAGASASLGSRWATLVAILVIIVWAATGPIFHYSDTWQLVINTGTSIVTFLMVFLIQGTQNRDSRAINLKLDELIHATDAAGNHMMDIERLSDQELDAMHAKYERIRGECLEREKKKGS